MCFRFLTILLFCSVVQLGFSQQNQGNMGTISGRFEANGNFFQRDSTIGAFGTPQYDRQLYGADAWLNLNYSNWGFDFGLRFDLFNNSNLLNPQDSYTGQGIGMWFIRKKIYDLDITVGYFYDQIGAGTIFRAYEQRPLLIDNALYGVRLLYDLTPDLQIKLFTGKQKLQFDTYGAIIKGGSLDGFFALGKEGGLTLAPGFGAVNRTYNDEITEQVVNTIASYTPQDSFSFKHNNYAFSIYNTLSYKGFSWYIEGAYKTRDVFNDPFAEKLNWTGDVSTGKLVGDEGNIVYTSLSYATKGLGITVEGKRTENFTFRTEPFVELNRGIINFLPPMARVNTYRLTARYNAATQELGELAYQIDVRYSPSRKVGFYVNYSNITDLNNNLLYREIFTQFTYKYKRKWNLIGGVQFQNYNQEIFETKPGVDLVETFIPYVDFLYKFDRKRSIRFEAQYMATGLELFGFTNREYGDWLFGLVEFSIAPHWTFTVSDMYNIDPQNADFPDSSHYPRFDVFYTNKANRFSLSYIKQVEGVVCTGGICRLEPAFSGVKLTVNSSF